MMDWQPIETAPKDGTPIQARIPGDGDDNIIAWEWFGEGDCDEHIFMWTFVADQEPPSSWTDGWCWGVNENGDPSIQPTHWKTPPPPTQDRT